MSKQCRYFERVKKKPIDMQDETQIAGKQISAHNYRIVYVA